MAGCRRLVIFAERIALKPARAALPTLVDAAGHDLLDLSGTVPRIRAPLRTGAKR